jgi:hypothetical protein
MEQIGTTGAVVPCQTNSTTDGSATTATIFRYDRDLGGQEFATASKFGNQTDVYEYVSAPAIERDGVVGVCPTTIPSSFRRTHTDYKFDYMGSDVHLRHLPTAVTVYNSGGSVAAKTTYGYDQTSVPVGSQN